MAYAVGFIHFRTIASNRMSIVVIDAENATKVVHGASRNNSNVSRDAFYPEKTTDPASQYQLRIFSMPGTFSRPYYLDARPLLPLLRARLCRNSSVNIPLSRRWFDKIRRAKSVYLLHNRREADIELRVLSGYLFSGESGNKLYRITNDCNTGKKALSQDTQPCGCSRRKSDGMSGDETWNVPDKVSYSHDLYGGGGFDDNSCIFMVRLENIHV